MLTLQEIQSVSFEKAVFGGYDMKSVDNFVEKVTEDYSAMQKENAALKAKMKVLVDKIEEYRSVEDGMRKALLSAQNIASETIEKAKKEKEEILKEASNQAENKVTEYVSCIQEEKAKLLTAKKETRQFVQYILGQYADAAQKLHDLATEETLESDEEKVSEKSLKSEEKSEKEEKKLSPEVPIEEVHIAEREEGIKDSITEELNEYMNEKMNDEHSDGFSIRLGGDVPKTTAKFDFGELPLREKNQE